MYKVSVIIPIYNVELYIEKCARSLFEQTLRDIEFIFVDDCSKDNSVNILNEVIKEYPHRNITLIKLPINSGVSVAREIALSKAKGLYIGFCDSDDWVEPNMFEVLLKHALEMECDIIGCGFYIHNNNRINKYFFPLELDNRKTIFTPSYFGGIFGALCNKLIRRDFFDNNSKNLWKGLSMWEDSCMLIPLRLKSSKTIFIKECLYHYNVNQNSFTTKFSIKKVNDAVEATKRLEQYFISEDIIKEATPLIRYLKIASKEVLLRYPNKGYLKMWKEIFPETKWYLYIYNNWNLLLKIRAILVSFIPISLGVKILKLKSKQKRF